MSSSPSSQGLDGTGLPDVNSPAVTRFAASLPYRLDAFQRRACSVLDRGDDVLVCAPTGAGKTVIGRFAAQRALARGRVCFYTTPLKALSNQKYREFSALFGADRVGLMTGDTVINAAAPVLVMTTEVLRNMLYVGAARLSELSAVVLDEVHFLGDKARGVVWEEVLLHLSLEVQMVSLSATVSNAEEFGAWLREIRGETDVIVSERRPVPLAQHMMVGRHLYDLYTSGSAVTGTRKLNPELRDAAGRMHGRVAQSHRGRWRPTPRSAVIEQLDRSGLLPAIVFIFSRAGCDAAVEQCVRSGVRLVDDAALAEISEVAERHTRGLADHDREAVGYRPWLAGLQRGIAAHHAGALPAFKEAVEELFGRGLVKVVFATETLALGINMPARTVAMERTTKFDGEGHVDITPGQYTQLTGRAGRRGIDVEGHAVVLWSPETGPRSVDALASTRSYPLTSSFAVSYNMTVNLIDRHGQRAATRLLERSFAQFQTDSSVVGLAQDNRRDRDRAAALGRELTCDCGDVAGYVDIQARLSRLEREQSRARASRRRQVVADDLGRLKRGDVIHVSKGRRRGLAVVLDPRPGRDGTIRPLVVTDRRWAGRLDARDFAGPIPALGRIKLRKVVEHWKPAVRRDLASSLAATGIRPDRAPQEVPAEPADDTAIPALRREMQAHPVHACSRRSAHIAAAAERASLYARIEATEERIRRARESLARRLQSVAALLRESGYLADDRATDKGAVLRGIWGEADLLAAHCVLQGRWATLSPPVLAGAVAMLVFRSRSESPGERRELAGELGAAADSIDASYQELARLERRHGVALTPAPDRGVSAAITAWAEGAPLADCLAGAAAAGVELSAGDFVRWCRQVIDLLAQLKRVAPPGTLPYADAAIVAIRRGVVALGSA